MTKARDELIELSKKYGFEDILTQYGNDVEMAMLARVVLGGLLGVSFVMLFKLLGV